MTRRPRIRPLHLVATLSLLAAAPAGADDSFWRGLAAKYGPGRPAIGLLNECLDYVTYAGEVEIKDVTQQSGLEQTKTAAAFKGSQFLLDSRFHWMCAVIDAEQVPELATVRIPFHSERTISDLSARVILRDGTSMDVPKSKIVDEPMAPGFPAYADLRWRAIHFGPLPDSCVLDLKYALRGREAFASNRFLFDHPYPVDRVRYLVSAPTSVVTGFPWWTDSFRADEELGKPKIESVAGSTGELQRYEWSFGEVPEVPSEELSVPLAARARAVELTVAFERDWDKMLAWYRGEVERVYAADTRGAEMAAEMVRGISDDSLKARVIYDHVKRRVRWVSIPANLTRLVPDAPSEVLERGYGDAKDIAACLAFLLRSAGLQADMALVPTAASGRFEPRFPTFLHFDHALVHAFLPLRDVWLDATDPAVGFGSLSERVRGGRWDMPITPFLVWDGSPNFWDGTTSVIDIPSYGLSECGYELTAPEIVWDPAGKATCRLALNVRGAPAVALRRALLGKSREEQESVLAEWLERTGSTEGLGEFSVENVDSLEQDTLRVRCAVTRAWTPGADEIRLPSRFFGLLYPVQAPREAKRYGSVSFAFPEELSQNVRLVLPEGYEVAALPPDVEISSSFMRYERRFEETYGGRALVSSFRIEDSSVDAAQYGRLLKALEEIRRAGDEEIVLRRTPLLGRAGE